MKKRIETLKDDVIIFPETHIGAGSSYEILEYLDFKGWKAVATPSQKSKRAELAGGIGLAARSCLAVQSLRHLAAEKEQTVGPRQPDADWSPGPIDFQDMTAITWRWKGH